MIADCLRHPENNCSGSSGRQVQIASRSHNAVAGREDRTASGSSPEAGNTLIEVALILPVFFLMVFGFINFTLVIFGACNITYASRSAVRYAGLHSSTSLAPASTQDITNIVNPFLFQYPKNTSTTTLTYNNGNVVGSTVTISIAVTYNITLPFYSYSGLKIGATASGWVMQ